MRGPWRSDLTWAFRLSYVVALLVAAATLVGIMRPGLYRDPETFIRAGWLGNDAVVLVAFVPALVWATHRAAAGSRVGAFAWMGTLDALAYNYAFYAFGATPNRLLVLHIAIVALTLLMLIAAVAATDADRYAVRPLPRSTRLYLVGYMSVWGLVLGVLWIVQAIHAAFTGSAADLNGSTRAFQVTATLDLVLVVPFVLLAVVLLARRHAWAMPLAGLLNVKGILYPAVLIGASVTAHQAGVANALSLVPLWAAFILLSAYAVVLLVRHGEASA